MNRYGFKTMLLPVLLILLANGIFTFAYVASTHGESQTLWGLFAVNYLIFLGLAQTGIIFSTIMRVAKSTWATYFNRLGEVLTLATLPVAIIGFCVLYFGGAEHLFYWMASAGEQVAHHGGAHGAAHLSPWLNEKFFLWRYVATMGPFYLLSFLYFRGSREEETHARIPDALRIKMSFLGGFIMFFYVWGNTNLAWDFAMMNIRHWESTIFPGYYWVGHLLAGPAFLFILARVFIKRRPGEPLSLDYIEPMGKLLMGFTLTWLYMFWSQHIVMWYPELTHRYGPLLDRMSGNYLLIFLAMMFALSIIPFFFLMFRRIKLTVFGLTTVAVVLCLGLWLNRFLLIIPTYSDGSESIFGTYVNFSLALGFLAATLLSIICFFRLFPAVTIRAKGAAPSGGGH